MRNNMILVGAAALAISGASIAKPGGGNGGGGGPKSGGGPAHAEHGGGPKGGGDAPQMRGGGGPKFNAGPRPTGGQEMRKHGGGGAKGAERQQMRGPGRQQLRGPDRRTAKVAQKRGRGVPARAEKQHRENVRQARGGAERLDGRVQQANVDRGNFVRVDQSNIRPDYFASPTFRSTGLIDGCPPGLAAKNNGCLPPGQAKKWIGAAAPAVLGSALLPPLYRSWYPDNDDYYYRTYDDYVYRIDRDRNTVDGYFPLYNDWNGAYYVGAAYPQDYLGYYNVPVQYQPWYADNDDSYYRYGDGSIYQVDPNGGVIEGIVALLAGGFGVGQPLPAGYDVYNVPYGYRDQYVDSPDAWYRYNDGNIYRVDPTTQIVQAIVESLV